MRRKVLHRVAGDDQKCLWEFVHSWWNLTFQRNVTRHKKFDASFTGGAAKWYPIVLFQFGNLLNDHCGWRDFGTNKSDKKIIVFYSLGLWLLLGLDEWFARFVQSELATWKFAASQRLAAKIWHLRAFASKLLIGSWVSGAYAFVLVQTTSFEPDPKQSNEIVPFGLYWELLVFYSKERPWRNRVGVSC